jgi:hypothetical protein
VPLLVDGEGDRDGGRCELDATAVYFFASHVELTLRLKGLDMENPAKGGVGRRKACGTGLSVSLPNADNRF